MDHALATDVREILLRDLQALAEEVVQTPEEHLWEKLEGMPNPVGTLAWHLCGNLRHFVGAGLGADGYLRSRDAEFSLRGLGRQDLLDEIEATRRAVDAALRDLPAERLAEPMPITPPQHEGRTVGFFLVQLCCHLSRHRGQLNAVRRALAARQPVA